MCQTELFENSLFRYRSCNEKTIRAFINDQLYFSTPRHFNDPFDAVIYVNEDKLFSKILRDWDIGMDSYLDSLLGDPSLLIPLANKDNMLKYTQDTETRVSFLTKVLQKIDDIKQGLLTNAKTICFSKEHLSILMWSHYANYHEGFVLAFQKEKLSKATCFNDQDQAIQATLTLKDIHYHSYMNDYGEFFYEYLPKILTGLPPVAYARFLAEMMFNKTKEWGYEQEWRLCSIPNDFTQPDPACYLSIRPWAVFLGAKMPAKQKWQIYNIAKKKDITVFEVWANNSVADFKLNFQKVNARELKKEAEKSTP